MTDQRWTAVDRYINETFALNDPILDSVLQASEHAGLPSIQVSPSQGKLLQVLARSINARNILEIGTLGGYSTICLGRALPVGGRVITLEASEKHAEVAHANFGRAGLKTSIELRLGPALASLRKLADENPTPFDFIFIDANKSMMDDYFDWSLKLARPGALILADNVIRDGAVADPHNSDPDVQGVQRFNLRVAGEPRVSATEIQTVGSKGYDGFALILVLHG